MASSAASAPSTPLAALQIAVRRRVARFAAALETRLEAWLERERDQLFLWAPVAVGSGVALWFSLAEQRHWTLLLAGLCGTSLVAAAMAGTGRAARAIALAAMLAAMGLALVWLRSIAVAAPVLDHPRTVQFDARIERLQPLAARGAVRLRLAPVTPGQAGGQAAGRAAAYPLPPHVRVTLPMDALPKGAGHGAIIRLSARLVPPPGPGVPGAYDYARAAWFDGIGAAGRGYAPVTLVAPAPPQRLIDWDGLRARLSAHVRAQAPGGAGAIAAALASGDQGAMPEDDAEAMRRAGLTHLLSVSGLHITAAVGAVMLAVLRLLALSPWLALRLPLPLVAAGAGAMAAIGYTLLTGAEVPTVRSCVAALMVLAALTLGRQAVTLRLVAVGALVILILWPEAVIGPSFQLSFAAVGAIVALHEQPWMRRLAPVAGAPLGVRIGREAALLLLTGIVVEAALAPIALFHFHKAGLYGALANIIAIPLTTFVVMPAEALALLFDLAGLGAPFWWVTSVALDFLLWLAHRIAAAPGAVAALPAMPGGAFALIVGGGLWLALWRTRWRLLGVPLVASGAAWAGLTPAPDLLITGDGRHLALRLTSGDVALLRDRTGDYVRQMMAENSAVDDAPLFLSDSAEARCSRDACVVEHLAGGRRWRVLATRSGYTLDYRPLIAACAAADIVVSDRRLPRACTPRWRRFDKPVLARSGGIAVHLAGRTIATVRDMADDHPWRAAANGAAARLNRNGAAGPQAFPAPAPGADHNAGDHKRDLPDQAGSSRLPAGNI